jgi:hypothetical protein
MCSDAADYIFPPLSNDEKFVFTFYSDILPQSFSFERLQNFFEVFLCRNMSLTNCRCLSKSGVQFSRPEIFSDYSYWRGSVSRSPGTAVTQSATSRTAAAAVTAPSSMVAAITDTELAEYEKRRKQITSTSSSSSTDSKKPKK